MTVTEIHFELVVDGKRKRMTFFTPEKIDALLMSEDSIGAFLREMRDTTMFATPTKAG